MVIGGEYFQETDAIQTKNGAYQETKVWLNISKRDPSENIYVLVGVPGGEEEERCGEWGHLDWV